jgi:hypothetical protein
VGRARRAVEGACRSCGATRGAASREAERPAGSTSRRRFAASHELRTVTSPLSRRAACSSMRNARIGAARKADHRIWSIRRATRRSVLHQSCVRLRVGLRDDRTSALLILASGVDTNPAASATVWVGSDRSALSVFPLVGFCGPPAEPGVRLSTHRALHVSWPLVSRLLRLPVSGSMGS